MDWVADEHEPLIFRRRDGRQVHVCGPGCGEPTVELAGCECCPISRMRMGDVLALTEQAVLPDEEEQADLAASRRGAVADPLEVDGAALRREIQAVYARLFGRTLAPEGMRAAVQRALAEAKAAK